MTFISAYGYGSYSGYGYNTLQQQNTQSCSSTNKVSGFTLNTDGTFSLTCSPITGFVTNETDPFWLANYSDFLNTKSLATNNTFAQLIILNNGTYTNMFTGTNWTDFLTTKSLTTNNTFAQLSILNNGTYSNVLAQTLATNNTFAQLGAANSFGAFNQTFDTRLFFLDSTNNRVGINTTIPSALFDINSTDNTSTLFKIQGWNATGILQNWLFVQNATGNVGIGAGLTNPQQALNVKGDINATGTIYTNFNQNLTIPYLLATNNTFSGIVAQTLATNNTFAQLASTANPTNANFTGNLSVFQNFTVDAGTFNIDSNNNKISVGGNLNITTAGNITINTTNRICLNYACSQWMLGNATGVFIQG